MNLDHEEWTMKDEQTLQDTGCGISPLYASI